MSLDLEQGDEARADEISARERRRQRRRENSANAASKSTSKPRTERSSPDDKTLVGRLTGAFTRIAEQLRARNDDELAEAIEEDKQAMAQGLVSLTRHVAILRLPLVLLLDLVEPLLAFYRVGRILLLRFVERRQRMMQEAQRQEAYPMGPAVTDAEVVR